MLFFKSMSDVEKLSNADPAFALVADVMQRLIEYCAECPYDPDLNGYVVLVQSCDVDGVIPVPEVDCRLDEVFWEAVTYEGGMFHAVHLCNNEFALGFLIPDEPWVNGKLRASLLEHLSE
jgi:hypothetical protein